MADSRTSVEPIDRAMALIELLAVEVGPRRPTSRGERLAAELMRDELSREGLEARLEGFRGYPSFGPPFGLILAAAIAPSLMPPRFRAPRAAAALASAAGLVSEGSLRWTPLSDGLSQRSSANLVGMVEPRGETRRTLCLMGHLDTSRSGLMFAPGVVRYLDRWIRTQSVGVLAQAAGEAVLGGTRRGRRGLAAIRLALAVGLGLLVERELRGEDVPGANDNASGSAVAAVLASEVAAEPLATTRLVLLLTGCEEAGTLGAQAFLGAHDTTGWLFLNFDNVGGGGSVRFLRREGVLAKWSADAGLIGAAQRVAEARPELRMAPEDHPAGLTYDSSPVLATGGRALTLSVQDGSLPNLHWPTDTYENVDEDGVQRTLEAGRDLIRAIDEGAADLAMASTGDR